MRRRKDLTDEQWKFHLQWRLEYQEKRARNFGFFPERVTSDGEAGFWVVCADCGHLLRANQFSRQLDHQFKHNEQKELDKLRSQVVQMDHQAAPTRSTP